MTIFVEVFNLFNNLNEIDLFMTALNKEVNEFFDLKFNVFLSIDFLN